MKLFTKSPSKRRYEGQLSLAYIPQAVFAPSSSHIVRIIMPFASVPTDRWVAEPISYGPHGLLVRPLWGALETPGKSVIYIYIYIDIKVQIEQWDWYSNVPVCRPHWVYRTTFRETHSQIPLDSHIFGSKPIA